MNKINLYKYIIIYIIIIHDINLVRCGDRDPGDQRPRERIGIKRPAPTPAPTEYGSYGSKVIIELDINAEKSTEQYYYAKTRMFIMFTPKGNYIFGSLREGLCHHCGFSNRVLWVAKDQNEFSNKVVVPLKRNGTRVDYSGIKVIIYQSNGKRRFFSKRNRFASVFNNEWMEKIYNIPVEEHPPHIEIVTAEDLNGTNPVRNDLTKYTVSKNVMGNEIFEVIYSFPNSSNCIEVKYNGETVWKYDPKYLNIWKIYYTVPENMLSFSYNSENYYCFRNQNN